MQIGAFGDFVFWSADGASADGACTFNALSNSRASRLATHATIEGLPVVEFLGLDAETIKLTGQLCAEISGNIDRIIDKLRALQDGKARMLTRGSRVYGKFLVRSIMVSEDVWAGDTLAVASYQMDLIGTR